MKCASVSRVLVAALAATSVLVPSIASADDPYDRRGDGYYDRHDDRYDDRYDDRNDERYRDDRYRDDRYRGQRVRYGDYRYYEDTCKQEKRKRRNTGAAVGAVAGATVGSQVAGRGQRTEGAVLGAVAGAVIGAEVGRKSAKNSAACDAGGPYWSRNDTRDWRYGERWQTQPGRRNDAYYARQGCRWAQDYRGDYFRVCPDRQGRYRVAY